MAGFFGDFDFQQASPEELAQMIADISRTIQANRTRVQTIRDLPWYKRFFANKTRDLATALLDQNQAFGIFLELLQRVIWMNLHNTMVLAQVAEELHKRHDAEGESSNQYLDAAKRFVSQAYASAIAFKEQTDRLRKAVTQLQEDVQQLESRIEEMEEFRRSATGLISSLDATMRETASGIEQLTAQTHQRHQNVARIGYLSAGLGVLAFTASLVLLVLR